MYLILPIKEAQERNRQEAIDRKCEKGTNYWWHSIPLIDGKLLGETDEEPTHLALNVGDGDGLTKKELKLCVDKLPE